MAIAGLTIALILATAAGAVVIETVLIGGKDGPTDKHITVDDPAATRAGGAGGIASRTTPRNTPVSVPTPSGTPDVVEPLPSPALSPVPAATVSSPDPPELTDVQAAFFRGYRDAGGIYPEAHILAVMQCEHGWQTDSPGYYYGIAQFAPGTWENVSLKTGRFDYSSPYDQGFNVAVWSQLVDPGSRAGWPICWWVSW